MMLVPSGCSINGCSLSEGMTGVSAVAFHQLILWAPTMCWALWELTLESCPALGVQQGPHDPKTDGQNTQQKKGFKVGRPGEVPQGEQPLNLNDELPSLWGGFLGAPCVSGSALSPLQKGFHLSPLPLEGRYCHPALLCGWGNAGSERSSHLPKVTQQRGSGAWILIPGSKPRCRINFKIERVGGFPWRSNG